MAKEREERTSTLEQLLPKAISVDIKYVDGSFLGERWFELDGEGRPALEQLVLRFGQDGVDAFNKAFITPDFEKHIEDHVTEISDDIKANFEDAQSDPDLKYYRGILSLARDGLQNILNDIRIGNEVPIRIHSIPFGFPSVKFPSKDAISIILKKPADLLKSAK